MNDDDLDQQSFRETDHSVSPLGQGNVVSIEFNFLYHWHASICEEDENWLNGLVKKFFGNEDLTTVFYSCRVYYKP